MNRPLAVVLCLLLTGCLPEPLAASAESRSRQEAFKGAKLVRICHSGAKIYQLTDGTYRNGPWEDVIGPEVCL